MIPLPEIHYDEWFDNPLDSMPIAKDPDEDPIDTSPSEIQPPGVDEPPRPEEEIADAYSSRHQSTPEFEKTAEGVVTMHERMYRIATSKYNPFAVGGSESIHDFEGGSENVMS